MVHTSESIKTKFVLSISSTVVFFLMVLLFVSYSLLRDTALKNARELSLTILTETDKQIDTFFGEIEDLAHQMSGYPAFYEVRTDEMRTITLSTVRARLEYLRAVYLGTVEGEMWEWGIGEGFVDNTPIFEPGYDPRRRPWYEEALAADGFAVTKPYVYASVEALGITGVIPVYHPSGRFVGVLGLDIMLDDLKRMIEELRVQKGGRVILLNSEDQVIVNQFERNGKNGEKLELKQFSTFDLQQLAPCEGSHFITAFEGEDRYYITCTENATTGWRLIIALPYDEVMAQATENIKFVIFIDVLLMLLLSVVIGFLSNIIIIHPLEVTVGVMRRLEQGESEARVEINRTDEFGILAQQFNRLIGIVNDYRLSLEEKVRIRTEENAALQQENVRLRIIEEKERIYGYLHDSLGARLTNIFISNNVAQSAAEDDPAVLQEMLQKIENNTQMAIEDLKEILFSSQVETRKMIDFPKLLKHNISERLQLKEISFVYSITRAEEFSELDRDTRFEIEKILQELVSNVLKHSQAGRVDFSMNLTDGQVEISFEDDGVGFDMEATIPNGSSRFGLHNMRHRVENLGGFFHIQAQRGGGVQVKIALPIVPKERDEA